ncbi:YkgJ family cysteine cluster protein [Candidatus Thorarchaeota archaeon]|nr:MAG: YkgJ family cysteine cluster protein [Candidatus Thorarchaeota archaeon]
MDTPKEKKELCIRCGALCCRLGGAVATRNEVEAIIDAGYEDYFKQVSPDVFITHWGREGVCPYLQDDTCSIYEVRPLRCRAFPVHQDSDGEIYLSLCPLASSLDDTEIASYSRLLRSTPSGFLQAAASVLETKARILQRRISRYPRRSIALNYKK